MGNLVINKNAKLVLALITTTLVTGYGVFMLLLESHTIFGKHQGKFIRTVVSGSWFGLLHFVFGKRPSQVDVTFG